MRRTNERSRNNQSRINSAAHCYATPKLQSRFDFGSFSYSTHTRSHSPTSNRIALPSNNTQYTIDTSSRVAINLHQAQSQREKWQLGRMIGELIMISIASIIGVQFEPRRVLKGLRIIFKKFTQVRRIFLQATLLDYSRNRLTEKFSPDSTT